MPDGKKKDSLKLLRTGNKSYLNALDSSALLLAKSLGSSFQVYQPTILCLTFDDQMGGIAHVLFNQNRSIFSSFIVNEEGVDEETLKEIEAVTDYYPIEVLLILDHKSRKGKKLGDFASDLMAKSSLVSTRVQKGYIDLILGYYDAFTGEVALDDFKGDVKPVSKVYKI